MKLHREQRQSESTELADRNYELLKDSFDAALNQTPVIEGSQRILGITTEDGRIMKLLVKPASWEETMANFSLLVQSTNGKIRSIQLTGVVPHTETNTQSRYNISLDLKPETLAAVSTAVDRLKAERIRNSGEFQTNE
ncbi:MAG: hypothetical protein ACYC5G_00080 [Candidatus Doudnabacteria bacterium]